MSVRLPLVGGNRNATATKSKQPDINNTSLWKKGSDSLEGNGFTLKIALKDVQALVMSKDELELRKDIAIHETIERNGQKLIADYAMVMFSKRYKKIPMQIGDAWLPMNSPMQLRMQDQQWYNENVFSPAERIGFWKSYKAYGFESPKSRIEGLSKIREALEHLLLPSNVRESLTEYLRISQHCLDGLPALMESASQELPDRFPTFESLSQVIDHETANNWFTNKFLRANEIDLKAPAESVMKTVREYLQVENLQTL